MTEDISIPFKPIIFSDFDGTITTQDSLVHILDLYGAPNWREIELRVKRGEIGSRVSLVQEFNTFHGSWENVRKRLIEDISIDRSFMSFLEFAKQNRIDTIVLSGGFESFIKVVFEKYGLENIPFFANRITFKDNKAFIDFPYYRKECGLCGHCKTAHLQACRQSGFYPVIYIGDGTTDRCPAATADLVFAKDGLARYCSRENIAYIEWTTFDDIIEYLKVYLARERCA